MTLDSRAKGNAKEGSDIDLSLKGSQLTHLSQYRALPDHADLRKCMQLLQTPSVELIRTECDVR